MEAADDDRNAGGAQRLGDMQRARILVGLHADQADEAEIIVGAHLGDDAIDADARIGLVDGDDVDVDVGPENFALRAVVEQAVDAGQRIRRHRRAVPADDIAVVVVMRRLHQHDAEALACGGCLGPLLRQHASPRTRTRKLYGLADEKPDRPCPNGQRQVPPPRPRRRSSASPGRGALTSTAILPGLCRLVRINSWA